MNKLTDPQVAESLKGMDGWARAGDEIAKTFSFRDFYQTIGFVNAVAWIANTADHHPDLEVGYNRCKVRYSTHSAGGISEKDFACARKIEQLFMP